MNKQEWIERLNQLLEKARKEAWEKAQDDMIDDFEEQELERLGLFSDNDNVGYEHDMMDLAQRFQGQWKYERSSNMTAIF